MKSSAELARDMSRAIGIGPQTARHEDLLLIRAAIEMSHHAGTDATRVDETVLRFIRAVDKTVSAELIGVLREQFPPSDGAWLARLRQIPASESGESPAEAVHGYLALLTLLRLIPRNSGEAQSAWRYVDSATEALHVEPLLVSNMAGWLAGSADADVSSYMASLVQPLRELGALAKEVVDGVQPRSETNSTGFCSLPLKEFRTRLIDAVRKTEMALDALHISRFARQRLVKLMYEEHLRLAVLGEFKRGKSTLINALVGQPGLLPVASLPCTSGLIELRAGQSVKYEVNRDGVFGAFKSVTQSQFSAEAGGAAGSASRQEDVEGSAMPYWRVFSPSRFLEQGAIAILDTPGIGENEIRDRIAKQEAERADAVLLVFDATQPASLQELELIERLKGKLEDVIIFVNKADQCKQRDSEALHQHVYSRVADRTNSITADRIILGSAWSAEEAMRKNRKADEWLIGLEDLRRLVEQHLIRRSVHIKRHALLEKTNVFIQDMQRAVDGSVSVKRRQLRDLVQLQSARVRSKQRFDAAQAALGTAMEAIADIESVSGQLKQAFFDALPNILKDAQEEKDHWQSAHNPISSPKLHVKEVAEKARQSVLAAVDRWMCHVGGPLIGQEVVKRFAVLDSKLEALREYLHDATGQDPQQLVDQLKNDVMAGSLSGSVDDVSGGGAVLRVMVGGALASVIGYVIADVVLYYLLGAISGFLNPFLLGGAALLAVGLYVFKGQDWVRQWIRTSVAEQLSSALLKKDEIRGKLGAEIERSCSDLLRKLWNDFCERVQRLLDEVRYQQTAAEDRLRDYEERVGDLDADARAELERLEKLETEARRVLASLKDFVDGHAQPAEPAGLPQEGRSRGEPL